MPLFPPIRAGAKLLHAMHMHTCLRHPSQATPCLTSCLTACLTPCLKPCLTPCLTPCLRSRLTSCLTACHTSCLTPCLTPCLTACLTPDVCVTLLPHCIASASAIPHRWHIGLLVSYTSSNTYLTPDASLIEDTLSYSCLTLCLTLILHLMHPS